MAQLQQQFNAQQFDPTQGGNYQQLPVGKHPVVIIASEIKANNSNTGGMVVYELEVIDGPGKGSKGLMRINLYNASDKARQIAESQQAALCYVTGKFLINDTQELHGIPFAVDVGLQDLTPEQKVKQANGDTVTPFTQVNKILDIQGNEPRGAGNASAPPAQQQAAQPPAAAPAAQGTWGGNNAPAPAANAWGGNAQAQAQPPAPAPAAAGWQQGGNAQAGGATGKPSWGAK